MAVIYDGKEFRKLNLTVFGLLIIVTFPVYYLIWQSRISRAMKMDPLTNILLTIFTAGAWALYLHIKWIQDTAEINKDNLTWLELIFAMVVAPMVIQNNINLFIGEKTPAKKKAAPRRKR